MPLAFLSPWFLLAGLAVAVPVVIHLMQRRREVEMPFSMVRFVLAARRRSARRLKLRRLLLLALRMAAVLLAAVILARPVLRSPAAALTAEGGAYTVVIADNSLSMSAREEGGTRFELLREAASALLRGGEGGRYAVVPAARESGDSAPARWLDGGEALARLGGLSPLPAAGNLAAAFAEAYALLREAPNAPRQIAVFTDLALGSWSGFSLLAVADADPGVPVRIYRIGGRQEGAGLVAISAAAESRVAGEALTVGGRVVNRGPGGSVTVELAVDGETRDRRILSLPPGEEGEVSFVADFLEAGRRRIELRLPGDAYEGDDRRLLGITLSPPVSALLVDGDPRPTLVGSETFFVHEALRSERLARLEPIAVRTVGVEEMARTDLSASDVVLLANVPAAGAGPALAEFVSLGGGLAVFWGSNCDGGEYGRAFPSLLPARVAGVSTAAEGSPFRVGEVDYGDPAFSIFRPPGGGSFAGAAFYRRADVEGLGAGARVPARFADGAPWVVSGEAGAGRVTLFASSADLEWNDMATRPVFVPLLRRTVLALAGRLGEEDQGEVTAGSEMPLPGGERDAFTEATVTGPDGRTHRVEYRPAAGAAEAPFRGTSLPGFYEWSGGGREGIFAVNVPAEESDLRILEEGELESRFQGVPLDLYAVDGPAAAEFSQMGTRSLSAALYTALFFLLLAEMVVAGPRYLPWRTGSS